MRNLRTFSRSEIASGAGSPVRHKSIVQRCTARHPYYKRVMKNPKSHDVPRPQDGSGRCVERILAGSNHAVVDLIDALRREGDPRFLVMDRILNDAMDRIKNYRGPVDTTATFVVTEWHRMAVACVRIMLDPKIEQQAQAARDLT